MKKEFKTYYVFCKKCGEKYEVIDRQKPGKGFVCLPCVQEKIKKESEVLK